VVILSSLKEDIANYYGNNDEKAMFNIQDIIISLLLDNGFKLQDIDSLMVDMLRRGDRAKFKYYLIRKNNYNVKCSICSTDKDLELHHLKGINAYPELEFDEENVCFLCGTCHKLVHHGKGNDIKDNNKVKSIFKRELKRNRNIDKKSSNISNRLMVYFF
jgi:hypothetical protein